MEFSYKSFCWCFGTTSFRTKNFNRTIEEQLRLLNEFWNIPENSSAVWQGNEAIQTAYYDFMKQKRFVEGEANNKPKDAREKTSGLVDIGIIDENRHVTDAGLKLLEICDTDLSETNNVFRISKDSYFYLSQLLKVSYSFDDNIVRPFVIMLKVLTKLEYLTLDEFTYLVPLCINQNSTDYIISAIENIREGTQNIDTVIIKCLLSMDNYKKALKYFLENEATEEVISEIGMNRKSRDYDKPYHPLYKALYEVFVNGHYEKLIDVYNSTKDIKIGKWWRSYLFNTPSTKKIKEEPRNSLNYTVFSCALDESNFKTEFFKLMHLFKAKQTLSDYQDLNKRYIKTSDIVLFNDSIVKLDTLPSIYFTNKIDSVYSVAFSVSPNLQSFTPFDTEFEINERELISEINEYLGLSITNLDETRDVIERERYSRLNELIDTKFSKNQLLYLFECFENRKDNEIQSLVTDNADIPTIFEYVLGLSWYLISDRKGKVLEYLNLSLDANLLPKTHAKGGDADIVWCYEKSSDYPKHELLLEATLADSSNQRRMEMEPVSRHLGTHLLSNGNKDSYCIFATNDLNINVISDFRGRKSMPFYDSLDYSRFVDGMKIIPLQTSELKLIISKDLKYKQLYPVFEEAFNSNLPPHEWYKTTIVNKL